MATSNVVQLAERRPVDTEPDCKDCPCNEHYWSPDKGWKTKPKWYRGQPGSALIAIQNDVETPEEWAWLWQQVRQLVSLWEARTGRRVDAGRLNEDDQ